MTGSTTYKASPPVYYTCTQRQLHSLAISSSSALNVVTHRTSWTKSTSRLSFVLEQGHIVLMKEEGSSHTTQCAGVVMTAIIMRI